MLKKNAANKQNESIFMFDWADDKSCWMTEMLTLCKCIIMDENNLPSVLKWLCHFNICSSLSRWKVIERGQQGVAPHDMI